MAANSRLNILIFYADQHRAEAAGWSTPDCPTPNLERLARTGVRFDQCFCQYPVCTPSRMSFLTGQYVHTHGVHRNNAGLPTGAPTFARALREQGYSTACIGKMHFYPTYAAYGFDHMELAEQDGPGRFEDDYHRFLANAGALDLDDLIDQRREFREHAPPEYWQTFGARPSDLPEPLHSTTWIGDRTEAFLRSAEPPFCLWTGFIKPHHPFDPPASWLDRIPEAPAIPPGWTETIPELDAGKPGYFDNAALTPDILRHVARHYYATIAHIDAQIGRALKVLEERGLENTIVVYMADHGELLGYHHLLLKGGYLYDPLVRVPLIISDLSDSRGFRHGARGSALVESIDVTASILDLAGVREYPAIPGRSLQPVLRGETDSHRENVFAQNGCMHSMMLRTPDWKLIESGAPRNRMLFDLRQDPTELDNRYHDPAVADVRSELRGRLLEHLARSFRPDVPVCVPQVVAGAPAPEYIRHTRQRKRRDPLFRGLSPYAAQAAAALKTLEQNRGGSG